MLGPLEQLRTFQSTLSMRRATNLPDSCQCAEKISIHALHEESDSLPSATVPNANLFQSTLSMRRATVRPSFVPILCWHISIHALHEESDAAAWE